MDQSTKIIESVVRWPSRECWGVFVVYGVLLSIAWTIIYGGTCYITSLHGYRVPLHIEADLAMPFVPEAVVVYLSLFPMMWLAPFVLPDPERLRSLARALAWLFLFAGVGFLLIPSEEVRSTPRVPGAVGELFRFADTINLSYNNLPCLHVGMAVVCAYFYSQGKSLLTAVIVWLWAISIGISTLLTHQHYIADVIAGGGLAIVVARWSSRVPAN